MGSNGIRNLARLTAIAIAFGAALSVLAQIGAYDVESHWWLLGQVPPVAAAITAWFAFANTGKYYDPGEPKRVVAYGTATVVALVAGALLLRHLIADNASYALARIWSEQHYPQQPGGAQDLSQAHLTLNLTVHAGHVGYWILLVAAAAMLIVTLNGVRDWHRQRSLRVKLPSLVSG